MLSDNGSVGEKPKQPTFCFLTITDQYRQTLLNRSRNLCMDKVSVALKRPVKDCIFLHPT